MLLWIPWLVFSLIDLFVKKVVWCLPCHQIALSNESSHRDNSSQTYSHTSLTPAEKNEGMCSTLWRMKKIQTATFTQKRHLASWISSLFSLVFLCLVSEKRQLGTCVSWSPGSSTLSLVKPRGEARQGHARGPPLPVVRLECLRNKILAADLIAQSHNSSEPWVTRPLWAHNSLMQLFS